MTTAASTINFKEPEVDTRQKILDEINATRIYWPMKEDRMLKIFGAEYLIEMTRLFKM